MSTDITLVFSKDGSHTLLNTSLNETYHSRNGALQEALHVYIKNGLLVFKELEKIVVLEVGFGTGLNALLTWNKSEELKLKVEYHKLRICSPIKLPFLIRRSRIKRAIQTFARCRLGRRSCFVRFFQHL